LDRVERAKGVPDLFVGADPEYPDIFERPRESA
jgi:hypothetical protein